VNERARWRLLAGVPGDAVQRLLSIARRRRFARREVVFHRDDPGDSLHLVTAGRFAIRVMTPLGDTVTIAVRSPGDSFGEMALVGETARRSATVLALDEGETFCVYKDDFEELRAGHPSIDRVLLAFMVAEVRMLNERLLEALYVPADRRIMRCLVDLAGNDGGEVPLTQEELAEIAGTTRATVNRVLREHERRGTVALRRGRIVVLERARIPGSVR
jgi:CRP/FNR family transcriptional regulator, cyclic AMP receptor protein